MVFGRKSGGVGEGSSITKVRGSADRYPLMEVIVNAEYGNLWETYNTIINCIEY